MQELTSKVIYHVLPQSPICRVKPWMDCEIFISFDNSENLDLNIWNGFFQFDFGKSQTIKFPYGDN